MVGVVGEEDEEGRREWGEVDVGGENVVERIYGDVDWKVCVGEIVVGSVIEWKDSGWWL